MGAQGRLPPLSSGRRGSGGSVASSGSQQPPDAPTAAAAAAAGPSTLARLEQLVEAQSKRLDELEQAQAIQTKPKMPSPANPVAGRREKRVAMAEASADSRIHPPSHAKRR